MKTIWITLFLALFAQSAWASSLLTAGELATYCSGIDADKATFNDGVCLGFMSAWLEVTHGDEVTVDGQLYLVSIKEGVTVSQTIHVFLKYIKANPEKENELASNAVIGAMINAKLLTVEETIQNASTH
jgi:hypothetical protein